MNMRPRVNRLCARSSDSKLSGNLDLLLAERPGLLVYKSQLSNNLLPYSNLLSVFVSHNCSLDVVGSIHLSYFLVIKLLFGNRRFLFVRVT